MVVFLCKQTLAGVQGKDNPLLAVDEIMKIDDFSPDIGSWVKPSWESINNLMYSQDLGGIVLKLIG